MASKKILLRLLPAVLVLFIATGTPEITAAAKEINGKSLIVTTTDTEMHYGPDKNTVTMAKIPKKVRLELVSDAYGADHPYYLIRYNGSLGYISFSDAVSQPYVGPGKQDAGGISVPPVFWLSGDIWEGSYDELLKYYHMIPARAREEFESDGFHIIMTEEDITGPAYDKYGGYYGYGEIEGVCDYELSRIYIQDEYPRRILHEFGHYMNNKYKFSKKKGFADLCRSEAPRISMYAAYSIENPNEYFAEIFDLFIRDPGALSIISPLSYNEIASDISSFMGIE